MRPERPECQCLACAQLQHQQANDTMLLVAIGTAVVVGGLVWLVGQVAGLLASGTWPDVPLSELPYILVRLRDHAGDPAAAWPANVRKAYPGRSGCTPPWPASSPPRWRLGCWRGGCTSHPPRRGRQPPPPPAAGGCCRRPRTPLCRCCRHPSPGRRRDRNHPPRRAGRPRWPRQVWRGCAGEGRHQPRGGPPLRSHPPV
jgi:hypothetical protein